MQWSRLKNLTTVGVSCVNHDSACAGQFRARIDKVLMRFTDFMISLPGLSLLIILAGVDLAKPGPYEDGRHHQVIQKLKVIKISGIVHFRAPEKSRTNICSPHCKRKAAIQRSPARRVLTAIRPPLTTVTG